MPIARRPLVAEPGGPIPPLTYWAIPGGDPAGSGLSHTYGSREATREPYGRTVDGPPAASGPSSRIGGSTWPGRPVWPADQPKKTSASE
ncbi:hypothetical protein Mame01_11630 [Microbispora amethystogenes]|nr:hypothetical protein Mame01_11630 [Microbispora amethystogenes]